MNFSKFSILGALFLAFLAKGCSNDNSVFIEPHTIKKSVIPATADIVFHENNRIYVMDRFGGNVEPITFEDNHVLEHVAMSHDRTKIVANYFSDPAAGGQSSRLLLYDLATGTVSPLLETFHMAGNGGVDWDAEGYIYFAGVEQIPFANPTIPDEFKANAGANDIYRVRWDGTGLENLTNTAEHGEADVSVAPGGGRISYMATNIMEPENSYTEIWVRNSDGTNPSMVYTGGPDRYGSVHDPELSPDGQYVVFSRVNNDVPPVFPEIPAANTAHDILILDLNEPDSVSQVTQPGPISIIPDWSDDLILYLDITDKTSPPHAGIATIRTDGSGYRLIRNGANVGKWIPEGE